MTHVCVIREYAGRACGVPCVERGDFCCSPERNNLLDSQFQNDPSEQL
jgi:hypothetical protein